MPGDPGAIERAKAEVKQLLERCRGAIRTRVHPRDQAQLLDAIDRIQDSCITTLDAQALSTNIMRGKDSARKVLRARPVDMVQILNEIDGLEQEVQKLLTIMSK